MLRGLFPEQHCLCWAHIVKRDVSFSFRRRVAMSLQVLPDWHGLRTGVDGSYTQEDADVVEKRLMLVTTGKGSSGDGRSLSSLKVKYEANKSAIVALGNALATINEDALGCFKYERAVGPLPSGASRFKADVGELPADVQDASSGRTHRSCIEFADGSTCLETIVSFPRPVLFVHCDRDSIG